MRDSEMLDLIEYYQWSILWEDGHIIIQTKGGDTKLYMTIRQAVREALSLQANWSIGIRK